jgi:phenylalanyl-tRNA synthetase beta chain
MTALRAVEAGVVIGRAGELDPRLLAASDVRAERVAFAVLELDAVAGAVQRRLVRPIARNPAVERDLALVVAETVPAGAVESVIRTSAGALLDSVRLFDRYRGAPLAADEVGLGYRLRLQADHTLSEAEVEAVITDVVTGLGREVGARLRG